MSVRVEREAGGRRRRRGTHVSAALAQSPSKWVLLQKARLLLQECCSQFTRL